jgi:hypothetical protein
LTGANYHTAQNQPILSGEREAAAFIRASQAIHGAGNCRDTARIIFDQSRDISGATAGSVANIHAKEYQLYLPSKEELKQKLVEWVEEQEGRP